MKTHDHSARDASRESAPDPASRRAWWVFGVFSAFVLILFVGEHRAHLLGWLPWLIVLACPLMHLFMHGGHGRHGGHGGHGGVTKDGDRK